MRLVRDFRIALLEQQGHLFNWVPVCFGSGIGAYFSLRSEPTGLALATSAIGVLLLLFFARRKDLEFKVFLCLLGLVLAGFVWAGVRAHIVSAPVLDYRYYGAVEGRVAGLDRSTSDALRVTLVDVRLENIPPSKTPHRVRISLHSAAEGSLLRPGQLIGTTAYLSPPSGPVEPGGFDFQRHAWFQRLGAIGYTRVPIVALHPDPVGQPLFVLRMKLSRAIQSRMPEDVSGFAAAVTTGDRSAIPAEVLESLRISNLAHLLAISGLHMGLLAAFVFGCVRLGFALWPTVGLRWNGKKTAAIVALIASAVYLLLSGGSVSTQRAFVMTSVMLTAVLLDRRALSLRAVALAAIIVLLLRPESLLSPGFQMSFAATTALVAVFGALRDNEIGLGPRLLRPVSGLAISSLVAGLATAPIAALHFNHLAHYGLPANLLSVPVMGTIVVPSAVFAAVLSPFGLEEAPHWVMAKGLAWIQGVAAYFSSLGGARSYVVAPSGVVLPLVSLGALWVILWRHSARWGGAVVFAVALVIWARTDRPDILISENGGLVGIMTIDGRALSKAKGQGFTARVWLENDGLFPDQGFAASLWSEGKNTAMNASVGGGISIFHLAGKRAISSFDDCNPGDILVLAHSIDRQYDCTVFDSTSLAESGAVSITLGKLEPEVRTARKMSGQRLWHKAPPESVQ